MLRTPYLSIYLLLGMTFFGAGTYAQTEERLVATVDAKEAEKWREDLRYMSEEMPKEHRSLFHSITQQQFENAVSKLNERIPSLARHQIIVEMARIVAMVGDGHSNIAPTRDPQIRFRTYPVKLYCFKDGLFVRAATREHAAIVGSRVIKIGNATADQAYNAVREIISRDNEMDVKFFAPFLLTMPEVLDALGLIDDMESADLVIERQGKQESVTLKPFGQARMLPPDTDTSWMPEAGWVDARDNSPSPTLLWLRDPVNKLTNVSG
jgi:hypothetical protein